MGKFAKGFLALAIVCTVFLGGYATLRTVKALQFYTNCKSYIHRATNAMNIETSKTELAKAIDYIEQNNLTEGSVHIFFKNPSNDVGFWYNTLKTAYTELDTFPEDATQLEKSNFMMRMHESFHEVGIPEGISIYPNNILYFLWFILSLFGAIIFYSLSYTAYINDWA